MAGAPGTSTLTPFLHETVDEYLIMAAFDAAVHTWDLASAAGLPYVVAPPVLVASTRFLSDPGGVNLNQRFFIDAPVDSSSGDPADVFIAGTGRDPTWRPPTG